MQLKKWSAAYKWSILTGKAATPAVEVVANTLNALAREGASLKEDIYTGLQARLICHLAEQVRTIDLKTPKDVVDMTDAIERMRALAHALRGDKFTGNGAKELKDAATGTVVNLGGFKNKNNGGSNGHG